MENDEIALLLSDIKKSNCQQWIDLTEFLLLSGLRIGEAIALNKSDIDDEVLSDVPNSLLHFVLQLYFL